MTRPIPERLMLAASGRVPRIIGYRAAAWLFALDGVPLLVPEFAIPHGSRPRRSFDHQRRRIEDLELTEIDGVLVTSVRQTLADLCAVVDLDIVERAVESAIRLGLTTDYGLRDFAALCAFSRHGTPGLVEVLERRPVGARPTGSDLETLYLQVVRGGGIRAPERQFDVLDSGGERVAVADFGFPPARFVTETDGLATHSSPAQLQYDLNRQNRINDAGYELRRFTYHDVLYRPRYVCRQTARGLLVAELALSR